MKASEEDITYLLADSHNIDIKSLPSPLE